MDRGYIDYKQFDTMYENGIRFVTRLKENAIIEIVSENSVPVDSPIRRDSLVYLGKGNKKMSHQLRLIETIDSQGQLIRILTNEFQMEAHYIGEIYRNRWQIEVFFKWIKQHLTIKHLYGKSQSAVEAQLYLALILYCLLETLKLKTGYSKSLLEFVRTLKIYLFESYESFLEKPRQPPSRKTKGRRTVNCENDLLYQMTERQVMSELDAGQLYDLTYDPLFYKRNNYM
jgi:IS4 transposase